MTINYPPKINERVLGQEALCNETHTIGTVNGVINLNTAADGNIPQQGKPIHGSQYQIKLNEVPLQEDPSTVIIPGFFETVGSPSNVTQFVVNYTSGYVTFHPGAGNATVAVTYKGRGSEVEATDVNALQVPVAASLTPTGLIPGIVKPASIGSGTFTFDGLTVSDLTPNTVVISNGSKHLASSSVTDTEIEYVSGVTSSIQTQLDGKQSTLTPGTIDTTTAGVNITGGLNSTVGPNVTIDIQTATFAQPGLLSAADWITFNNKQSPLPLPLEILNGGTGVSTLPAGVVKSDGLDLVLSASQIVDADVSATASISTSKLSDNVNFLLRNTSNTLANGVRYTYSTGQTFLDDRDLVTKGYVDATTQGLDVHAEVALKMDPSDLPGAYTATGANATKKLTANANGAIGTIQGHIVALNDAIMLIDSPSTFDDGIYTVTALGDGSNPWELTRRDREDGTPSNEVKPGDFFFVAYGVAAATGWVVTGTGDLDSDGEIDIDNGDKFTVTQFSGAGTYTAGNLLTLTGLEFKLSDSLTGGQVIITDATTKVPAYKSVSGDITITDQGVTAIASGVIVNADVNAAAAIAESKLALDYSTSSLNTNIGTKVAKSGDTMTGTLTMSGGARIQPIKGTLSNVGIFHPDNSNCGIYYSSTNAVSLVSNASEIFKAANGTASVSSASSINFNIGGSPAAVLNSNDLIIGNGSSTAYVSFATTPTTQLMFQSSQILPYVYGNEVCRFICDAPSGGNPRVFLNNNLSSSPILGFVGASGTGIAHPAQYRMDLMINSSSILISNSTGIGIKTVPTTEAFEINGGMRLGNTAGTIDGTLRWTGSDFEGRKAGAWVSLTAGGGGGTATGFQALSSPPGSPTPGAAYFDTSDNQFKGWNGTAWVILG